MRHKENKIKGFIFVISGPSGSGKTTLLTRLLEDRTLKKKLVKSVSFTTRPKRTGERNGKDYLFIAEKAFKDKLKAKKILEWTRYLGYYYATPKYFVEKHLRKGKHVVLCLDLKGAAKIKKLYPKNTVTIFIVPPSLEELRERIEGRCRKTDRQEIKRRLGCARREIRACRRYDYSLVNKNLAQAVRELKGFIFEKTVISR